jgi:hypothetical protein
MRRPFLASSETRARHLAVVFAGGPASLAATTAPAVPIRQSRALLFFQTASSPTDCPSELEEPMRTTMDVRKRYGSLVGALGLAAVALAGCGEYHRLLIEAAKHGSGNHDPKPGEPPPPKSDGAAPACVDRAFDHDVTCADAAEAKNQAGMDCQDRGLELTAFGPASCAAGDLIRLKYTCCPEDQAPPPQTGSTTPLETARYAQYRCCPDSTLMGCLVQQLGGASVCEDTATFTAEASAACTKTGGTLGGVYLYAACTP